MNTQETMKKLIFEAKRWSTMAKHLIRLSPQKNQEVGHVLIELDDLRG
jgi:hypothetical protein